MIKELSATSKLNDMFWAYVSHLENTIADTSKQVDRATLQVKYNKLTDGGVILRITFLIDLLELVKLFSHMSQQQCVDFVTVANAVQSTRP